jgi:large subunit ribosomal protein L25
MYIGAIAQENFKIMHPDNTVICQVRTSRTAVNDGDDEDEDEATAEDAETPAAEAPAES